MSAQDWKQYICRACGLIYDEEAGDPDSGLAPGTRFEAIPDDWVCPLCGVTKDDFDPYERVVVTAAAVAGQRLPMQGGVVIVGAGLAGWSLAEALRAALPETPITLVSACAGDRYHKPELSLALGKGQTAADLVTETGAAAAGRLGLRLLANTQMVGLTPALHQLRTTRGQLRYSHLVLAQGASPMLPDSLPASLCWRVNHLQGWSGLQQRLQGGRREVLVIGAGMVGCELAEDLARSGHQVSLLDRQSWPLGQLLPELAGQRLRQSLEAQGVRYLGAVEVASLQQQGAQRLVTLQDGRQLLADEVVAATGLKVASRLVRSAGLAYDNGIVVDADTLQTSAADVFALGDCISIHGRPCRFIEPIARQAQAIARQIAGRDSSDAVHQQPVIRLKTRALPVILHGVPVAGRAWTVLEDREGLLRLQQAPEDGRQPVLLQLGAGQPMRAAA